MMYLSKSNLGLVLTAVIGTATALGAAPAQSGIQQLGSHRALQSPAPPNKVVIPPTPSTVIPISSLPFDINDPGYYQLTKDLVGVPGEHGIRVNASGAVIDLNEFSLEGGGSLGTLSGISCSSATRTTVFNGVIVGWGEDGIRGTSDCSVVEVASTFNGRHGLNLGPRSLVQDCIVKNNSSTGILGSDLAVVGGEVAGNAGDGIHATAHGLFVSRCTVHTNRGLGIRVPGINTELGNNPSVIEDCRITDNDLGGVGAASFAQVRSCFVADNALDGIQVGPFSQVAHCSVLRNAKGIDAGAESQVEACTVAWNERGIAAGEGASIGDCEVTDNALEGIMGSNAVSVQRCGVSRNKAGIVLENDGRIENCTVNSNPLWGILVLENTLVANNSVSKNQDLGILASGDANRIEGNHVALNGIGIDVQGVRNLIVRNSLDTNGVQMQIAPDNIQGPFLKTKGFIQSDNSWANFDLSFPTTFP